MSREFQPRYVAYARAHGRESQAQLDHDTEQWPGGKMCGFMLWIPKAWSAWATASYESREEAGCWSDRQHTAFNAWLGAHDTVLPTAES